MSFSNQNFVCNLCFSCMLHAPSILHFLGLVTLKVVVKRAPHYGIFFHFSVSISLLGSNTLFNTIMKCYTNVSVIFSLFCSE
jgi:hypothetical protein